MNWLVKNERYEFVYDSTKGSGDTRWDQLHNAIAKMGSEGWEPWGIETSHTFNTAYTELYTHASVWYKRQDI